MIARWAIKVGVERLIVLDLADVGVSNGSSSLTLCREIHREFPAIELIAGGGVRGIDDLKALADCRLRCGIGGLGIARRPADSR